MAHQPSPDQEARLRRLLARSRHDEQVPEDVAARLDDVLARLEAGDPELAGPRARKAEVTALAARRRRTAASLLIAAAAVVVVGVGVGQLVDGAESAGDSMTAGSDTSAVEDAEAADRSEGRTSGEELDGDEAGAMAQDDLAQFSAVPGEGALADLVVLSDRLVDVREADFTRAATRIQRRLDPTAQTAKDSATTPLRRAAPRVQRAWQGCPPADWGPGTAVAVLYDGAPAVLVFRPSTGDAQVADLLQCGTGETLRSVTLPGS